MLKKYLPDLLLLSIAIFWGASYSLTKDALSFTTVLIFLTLRFGITFLLLLPFTLKRVLNTKKDILVFGLVLGLILSLIFLSETYGVKYTTATNATLLISLTIIFTPYIDSFRTKQKPTFKLIIAGLLSILGIFILTYNQNVSLNIGDILILIAAILRAIMVTSIKAYTNRYKIDSLVLTQLQMGVVFAVSFILLVISKENFIIPKEINFWIQLGFIILFCTIFAFFAQNYGVKHSTPNKASLLMGTEPLF